MSAKEPSRLERMGTAIASAAPVRLLVAIVGVARAIAHSKGGRDIGAWLSYGCYELASVLLHGHSAIYPGRQVPGDPHSDVVQPIGVAPTVDDVQSTALTSVQSPDAGQEMAALRSQAQVTYAMSQANKMNVQDLRFDVTNVRHSQAIAPGNLPEMSASKGTTADIQPVSPLVDKHLEGIRGTIEQAQPELSQAISPVDVRPSTSMVDTHLQNLETSVEPASPSLDMDVDR